MRKLCKRGPGGNVLRWWVEDDGVAVGGWGIAYGLAPLVAGGGRGATVGLLDDGVVLIGSSMGRAPVVAFRTLLGDCPGVIMLASHRSYA